MAFPGLPETSKMQIFASIIVHHWRTNNVNVCVSKIYQSGPIFRKECVCVGGVCLIYIKIYQKLVLKILRLSDVNIVSTNITKDAAK